MLTAPALCEAGSASERVDAIVWDQAATVGHIAIASGDIGWSGDVAHGLPACRLSAAGKFRNGASRWWCVTHQTYWGVNADLARADGRCRAALTPLQVALDPLVLTITGPAGAPARWRLRMVEGAIAVHDRENTDQRGGERRVAALSVEVPAGLFAQAAIVRVNVTPPALAAMTHADGCVDCARCGYPHLDLGEFAVRAHRRHTCGHCGHDSTHSSGAIVSNPLYLLRDYLDMTT